jgi:hypothetical protein
MYAAGHNGALPQKLSDITQVPIPIDPVTGKDFIYKVADGKASIDAPAPPAMEKYPKAALHYELIVSK